MSTASALDHQHTPRQDDEGFTLVETIVALGLLGIIATATLGFFVSGMRTSADLQRRQVAVAMANSAVENARGAPVTMQTTTTGGVRTSWPLLVQGRTKAAVDAQWSTAPRAFTDTTFPAFDPQGRPGALLLPAEPQSSQVGTATYTTTTYVGTCYRLRSTSSQPCDRGSGTRSVTPPTGYEELVRITAVTSWGSAAECSGGPCSYTATLLVDTSTDPRWNTTGGQAVDDVATLEQGTVTSLDVLANDSTIPASHDPVTVGQVSAGIHAHADHDGTVLVSVPPNTPTGSQSLTYTVKDAYGATSNPATVRITVTS